MSRKETLREAGPAGWRDFCSIAGAESLGPSPQPWTRWGDLWQHLGDREAALRGWAQLSWARSVWGALFPDHDGVMSGPQELKG